MKNTKYRNLIAAALLSNALIGCDGGALNSEKSEPNSNHQALTSWNELIKYDSIIDTRDNNVYRTVRIGQQVWMAENLRYRLDMYTYYIIDSIEKYGYLYSWDEAVANTDENSTSLFRSFPIRGICPEGWHIPNESEVTTLRALASNSFFGNLNLSKILRSKSSWKDGVNGEDLFGFRALPAGYGMPGMYGYTSTINARGNQGNFWLSVESDRYYNEAKEVNEIEDWPIQEDEKQRGHSIRCISDDDFQTTNISGPLSDLNINWGALSPKFSPDIREYYDTIDGDVEEVLIRCTRTNPRSSLSISANNRDYGDNTKIYISRDLTKIVFSLNGKPEYYLNIVRKNPPTSGVFIGAPKFFPEPGEYTRSQIVTIKSSTPDAVIRYTTDASIPSNYWAVFHDGIIVTESMTITAIATKNNYQTLSQAEYVIKRIDPDTFELIGKWTSINSDVQHREVVEFLKSGNYVAFTTGQLSDTSTGFWSANKTEIKLIKNGYYGTIVEFDDYSIMHDSLFVTNKPSTVKRIFVRGE